MGIASEQEQDCLLDGSSAKNNAERSSTLGNCQKVSSASKEPERSSLTTDTTSKSLTTASLKNPPASFTQFLSLLFSVLLAIPLFLAVTTVDQARLPLDKHKNGSKYTPFVKDNAMRHIREIGTQMRHINTIGLNNSIFYVLSEMEKLKEPANNNGLEVDVELFVSSASSFTTDITNISISNSYDRIMSVVVKLRPKSIPADSPEKALLINSHLDSAMGAYGANDDLTGVGVMMEIARNIVNMPPEKSLTRPIVLLFNGAEEAILLGSHSFMTQHRWANTFAAHINCEALGPGNAFHLFRLGPHSPWLARAYAKAVSVPSGSVSGTDVFNAKVIPAETDFRMFDEVGNIPGYDFVFLDNGYVYHTIYDDIDHVDEVGVCHAGDTVFELSMELAGPNDAIGEHLKEASGENAPKRSFAKALEKVAIGMHLMKDPSKANVFFLDIIFFGMIILEEGVAIIACIAILLFTVLTWSYKFDHMSYAEFCTSLRFCFVLLVTIFAALGSAMFVALVYCQLLETHIRWYGSWVTALVMFLPQAVFGASTALMISLPRRLNAVRYDQMLFAVSMYYSCIVIFLLYVNALTALVFAFVLLVMSMSALQEAKVHPVLRHFQIIAVHAVVGTKMFTTAASSLLPLLGRLGKTQVHHDIIAAFVITLLSLLHGLMSTVPIMVHYANSLRKLRWFSLSFSVSTGFVLLVALPHLNGQSTPPSFSPNHPQRFTAIHFHSPQQNPESVLWLGPMDPNPLDYKRLLGNLPYYDEAVGSLPSEPVWGTMGSTPVEGLRVFKNFTYKYDVFRAGSKPELAVPSAKVLSEEASGSGWNVSIELSAPESHAISIRMHGGLGTTVSDWSFNAPLKPRNRGTWIRHFGTESVKFWVIVVRDDAQPTIRRKVPIVVCSVRFGFSRSPFDLASLALEKWETPLAVVSTGYEFLL